jgi:hypothetical protein
MNPFNSSIFSKIDVHYIINILRHQSYRNPRIRQQDLVLCLQIVTKKVGQAKAAIDNDVAELFADINKCYRGSSSS